MGLPSIVQKLRRSAPQIALTDEAPGTGVTARFLKIAIDIAYVAMGAVSLIMAIAFIVAIFIPLSNLSVTIDSGSEARQMPLTRSLLLFALGLIAAYFGGFFVMLRQLRQIFSSLLVSNPFLPANIIRLRLIGFTLTLVTYGGWLAQHMAARHLAPGAIEAPSFTELFTPTFAIIIVFVLSEVFREGSRLRQESELTI